MMVRYMYVVYVQALRLIVLSYSFIFLAYLYVIIVLQSNLANFRTKKENNKTQIFPNAKFYGKYKMKRK